MSVNGYVLITRKKMAREEGIKKQDILIWGLSLNVTGLNNLLKR